MNKLLQWDVYEISTKESTINGVMLRGRIRKFCLERGVNVLAENTSDVENGVRFALLSGEDPKEIITYVQSVIADASVQQVETALANPILSKRKCNTTERYTL